MVGFDETDKFATARAAMVRLHLKGRDITDSAVLQVMGQIPREEFVSEKYLSQAYSDCPLPIGMGQTISQPYIVALMTEVLEVNKECEVLEVGTGSGYQTAVLCRLAKKVYTIERLEQLSAMAQAGLGRVGIDNVEFAVGDGSKGWVESKIFDRIIVTAAVPELPQTLINQVVEDGLIVAPIGGQFVQSLVVCQKKQGKITERIVCDCRFVKLFGKYGYKEER